MFRKFCSSAVYSSVPHVLILTALTCGYNQQVITCKVCSFSQEQRDCILDFPFPYPRTRLIQTIPHPMVQRAKLVQWVFKGWALRKGDGSKWIKPCIPIIHFFWETKKPLLFTVIIVFLALRHLKGMVASTWMAPKREKEEDLSPICTHHICLPFHWPLLFRFKCLPHRYQYLGMHVFWVSHPCAQITATDTETKTLIMHLNKQTDHDKLHLIFWRRTFLHYGS